MNKLMYYPTILIPSRWLKKAIFLSDEISSIYPHDFSPSLDGLRDRQAFSDMEYLKSEGLYSYSRPEDLTRDVYKKIQIDLIEQLSPDILEKIRENFKSSSIKYEIYRSKMDVEIIKYLLDNQIATKYKQNHSILVEENVAMMYMSILASYSATHKKNFATATNSSSNMNYLFDKSDTLTNDYFMEIILNNVPQPDDSCSLNDIVIFKNKNQLELIKYRKYLSDWFIKLKNDNSPVTVNAFIEDMKKFNIEFGDFVKSSKISIVFDSIQILIPTLTSIISMAFDENQFIVPGAGAVAMIGLKQLRSVVNANLINYENPLNYVINARNENMLSPSSNTQT